MPRSIPAERIATEVFLPHRRKSDVEEPKFDGERVHLIPEVEGVARRLLRPQACSPPRHDYDYGGMQLPLVVDKACFAYFLAANVGSCRLSVAHRRPTPTCCWRTVTGADRRLRAADARRPLLRHHVPVRAAGRLVARRHRHARGAGRRVAARAALPAVRQQDVDLRRRARDRREHRPPGAREDPGRGRRA